MHGTVSRSAACVLSDQKIKILKNFTLSLVLYIAASSLVLCLRALCMGSAKPKDQISFVNTQILTGFLH